MGYRRSNIAPIITWTLAAYAAMQAAGQLIVLSLGSYEAARIVQITDVISARLLQMSAEWVEGSRLPVAQLLQLVPLLDATTHHIERFRQLDLAMAGFMTAHLQLAIFLLLPATILQVRLLQYQLEDLRRSRRAIDSTAVSSIRDSRTSFRKLVAALFVRSDPETISSHNRDTSQHRLQLLESICRNM
jgi:hypothetical protein